MKQAYPNFGSDDIYKKPVYNLNKWLDSMRQLYAQVHFGRSRDEALDTITTNWDKVEKRDFSNWMGYYESGDSNKYKVAQAQFYTNDNIPGYFIPNSPKPTPAPIPDISEPVAVAQTALHEQLTKEQKRKLIEEQRKKIIGRLNAAVKHLTAHEGHLLAAGEFEKLLASMYELIKQVQTVNKISLSSTIYKDLIIRQANKLALSGYNQSSVFLVKFAQNTPGTFNMNESVLPIESNKSMGGPLQNPGTPMQAMTSGEKDPLEELLDNLETSGVTDANLSEDEEISLDEDVLLDQDVEPLKAEAQSTPLTGFKSIIPKSQQNTTTVPSLSQKELPTLTSDSTDTLNEVEEKDIDSIIDNALSSVTVEDIIRKLEHVILIFRNRYLSRELTIVDIMLNKLGLSPLFPELGEAAHKTLENSSYVLTRLEKIISQLRGSVQNVSVEQLTESPATSEYAQKVQQSLQEQQQADKDRKELRKKIQDEALDTEVNTPPASELNPAQELTQQPMPQQVSREAPRVI